LGFASGVMLTAAFFSLLIPAIENAKVSGIYGDEGQYAFGPVIVGFLLGALFCYGCDVLMSKFGTNPTESMLALAHLENIDSNKCPDEERAESQQNGKVTKCEKTNGILISVSNGSLTKLEAEERVSNLDCSIYGLISTIDNLQIKRHVQWKRIILLVIAVTVRIFFFFFFQIKILA
jgi:zinc transporter 11